jgi:hypothetical protein
VTVHEVDLDEYREVRRRILDPVIGALFQPGEIGAVELLDENAWILRSPRRNQAGVYCLVVGSGTAQRMDSTREAESKGLSLYEAAEVRHGLLGDAAICFLGPHGRNDPDDVAERLASDLEDWVCGTSWGWGQKRKAVYRLPR